MILEVSRFARAVRLSIWHTQGRKKKNVSSLELSGGGYSHKIRARSIRMLVLSVRTSSRHLQRGNRRAVRSARAARWAQWSSQKNFEEKLFYTGQLRKKHSPFKCISVAHTENKSTKWTGLWYIYYLKKTKITFLVGG